MNKDQIIRLAKQDPIFKETLISMLKEKQASRGDNDAAAFAAWAKMSNPQGLGESEVQEAILDAGLSISPWIPKEQRVKRSRKPLAKGNIVRVDSKKCSTENEKQCRTLGDFAKKRKYFKITKITQDRDLRIKPKIYIAYISFNPDTGEEILGKEYCFNGVMPNKGKAKYDREFQEAEKSGDDRKIKKALENIAIQRLMASAQLGLYMVQETTEEYKKSLNVKKTNPVLFVAVYERGTFLPTPDYRKSLNEQTNREQVEDTVLQGEFSELIEGLDKYNGIYYEGGCYGGAMTQAKSESESRFYTRIKDFDRSQYVSVSPNVGKCYWFGKKSDIPSNWKSDLRDKLQALLEDQLRNL